MNHNTHWTPAMVEQLTTLVAEGLSYGQIAAVMGAPLTRCSCIGKAKRLGLVAPTRVLKAKNAGPRRPPRPAIVAAVPDSAPDPLGALNSFPPAGKCQFMAGEPGQEWRMCGHSGFPWCEFHKTVVYARKKPEDEVGAAA